MLLFEFTPTRMDIVLVPADYRGGVRLRRVASREWRSEPTLPPPTPHRVR
jgi:hypothetical protein